MYETPNKVLEAARELGLGAESFRQVGAAQWEALLRRVFERFSTTSDTGVTWLWSHLKEQGVSVKTDNGLRDISALCPANGNVWLLVEDWDGTKVHGHYWCFEGAYAAAVAVLSHCHAMEYYIIDRELRWMIVENHHDVLIGIGEPAESFLLSLKLARQKEGGTC